MKGILTISMEYSPPWESDSHPESPLILLTFYGSPSNVCTGGHHRSLSWARLIQSKHSALISYHRAGWSIGNVLIQKILGFSLGRNTGNPDSESLMFSSVPLDTCLDTISISPRPLPFKSFPVRNSPMVPTYDGAVAGRYYTRPVP
jgi:hypothetical protein